MNFKNFVGIEVSKKSLDISIKNKTKTFYLGSFQNDKKGIYSFIKEIKSQGFSLKDTLICMEHTGIYTHLFLDILYAKKWHIWLAQAIDIKKSLGNQRGKNARRPMIR